MESSSKKGVWGSRRSLYSRGRSQGRNLGPRLGASPTHSIIREREREGVSPRGGEGGEISGLFEVKREGQARGPRAEDSSGPLGGVDALLGLLPPSQQLLPGEEGCTSP